MKGEAKELALGWGAWLLMGVMAAPHRYNTDIIDTISLCLLGLYTLFVLAVTVRFAFRLITIRSRTAGAASSTEQGTLGVAGKASDRTELR
ncbi:hypothetical protein ACIGO8_32965 [Streptomyces sp. NPDC053493]|uniref:hypothetical protein n=1 Tax=Streptomyces sp. NPDC053493 TaxID=3365705 RepID=UPI0037D4AE64